jgi:hypothetical protein
MPFNATRPKRFTGVLGDMPAYEQAACIVLSEALHIPPAMLGAIRWHENGRGGNEKTTSLAFGVKSLDAADQDEYGEQAMLCAESIRNNITRFQRASGHAAWVGDRLSDGFIAFMGSRYCPVGAADDAVTNLNRFWVEKVTEIYRGSGIEWA